MFNFKLATEVYLPMSFPFSDSLRLNYIGFFGVDIILSRSCCRQIRSKLSLKCYDLA